MGFKMNEKKKNMNENILITINNDINYLMHSGRKGQKKGVFGASGATRYQNHAVYAKTTPNPNEVRPAKSLTKATKRVMPAVNNKNALGGPWHGTYGPSGAVKTKGAIGNSLAKHRAKNDAALTVASGNNGANTKGARRLALRRVASTAAGASVGAAIGEPIGWMAGALATPWNPVGSPTTIHRAGKNYTLDVTAQAYKPDAKTFSRNLNNGLLAGRLSGAAAGAAIADSRSRRRLVNGYNNRVKNKNFGKMSSDQIKLYNKTYQDYLAKYAEQTRIPYGYVLGKGYAKGVTG